MYNGGSHLPAGYSRVGSKRFESDVLMPARHAMRRTLARDGRARQRMLANMLETNTGNTSHLSKGGKFLDTCSSTCPLAGSKHDAGRSSAGVQRHVAGKMLVTKDGRVSARSLEQDLDRQEPIRPAPGFRLACEVGDAHTWVRDTMERTVSRLSRTSRGQRGFRRAGKLSTVKVLQRCGRYVPRVKPLWDGGHRC